MDSETLALKLEVLKVASAHMQHTGSAQSVVDAAKKLWEFFEPTAKSQAGKSKRR